MSLGANLFELYFLVQYTLFMNKSVEHHEIIDPTGTNKGIFI